MCITLLNWIYIFITCYITGSFLLPRISRLIDADSRPQFNWCDRIIAGLVTATVYAGIFSLFGGVQLLANIIMLLCCAAFVYIDREDFRRQIKSLSPAGIRHIRPALLLIPGIALFILTLMYTAESTFHYDTGLYHAQAIHWIEDYGVIKGLGWIHVRLAYNSAYFPLCALYSLRFLTGGQSLHSMSGFIFMIMNMYSIYGWASSKKSGLSATLLRLAPVFYFLVCMIEITSPESDYITVNLIIWVFIRLVELHRDEESGDKLAGFCLIAICTFSLVGFKLSAAVITMITLWPLVIMIRKKNYKGIAICAALCILMVIPYLIRNVIICGWLVYPVDSIDLFNVSWKFPKDTLTRDANEIAKWARAMKDPGDGGSRYSWIALWWEEQYLATRMFISSMILSLPVMLILLIFGKDRFMKFIMTVTSLSLVFYLFKAPLIRYCYGPVLVLPLMVMGYMLDLAAGYFKRSGEASSKAAGIFSLVSCIALSAVIIYPSIYSCKELIKFDYEESGGRFEHSKYIVKQVDYPIADVRELDWYGNKVYLPQEGDQCWYYAFPSSPYHECFDYNHPISDDNDIKYGVINNEG